MDVVKQAQAIIRENDSKWQLDECIRKCDEMVAEIRGVQNFMKLYREVIYGDTE